MTINEWLSFLGYLLIPAMAVLYALITRFKSIQDDPGQPPESQSKILAFLILFAVGAVLYRLWESIAGN